MDWWMLAVGVALIGVAVFDLLATSVSSSTRAGPVTVAVTRAMGWVLSLLVRRPESRVLRGAGPATVSLSILAWLLLLWAGWTLVFSADVDAVVAATTEVPVGFGQRVLFTAYTVYSLGYGNYLPTGSWEVVAGVALINGLSFATLAVTYVIPVVTAVTDRRRQAAVISAAGITAEEIVETLHDANGFGAFDQLLAQLVPMVAMTGQRHLSYPVIHQYRGAGRSDAFPPAVAALDDAVTLLDVGVASEPRPNTALVVMWRRTVDELLGFVELSFPDRVDVPPCPSLAVLDRLGIDHLDEASYAAAMAQHDDRRRRLHRYVRDAHWPWPTA